MTVLVVAVPLAVCMLLPFVARGVWVPGETRSLARIALLIGPPLAAATAGLVITGLLIAAWLRGRAENRLADQEAVAGAAGGLPGVDVAADRAELNRRARAMRWQLPVALAGFPFVAWGFFSAARLLGSRWPAAPAWALYAGLLAPVALGIAAILLMTGGRRPAPLFKPAKWILFLAILFLFVPVFAPLGWVDRIVPGELPARLVKLGLLIALVTILFSGRNILAMVMARAAWRKGDYDRALARLRVLSFGRPTVKMLEMEGVTHALAARPAEAELCFREALARNQEASHSERLSLLSCLGETLADQGRYEEARRCVQAAVDMGDNEVASSRVDLAELLLTQGIEPQRALDMVDEAMRVAKGRIAGRLEPSRWAHRAWALALLGRREEAEQAIDRAFRGFADSYPPLVANTHWSAGMALLAMDETDRALEHLCAARDADPKGKYGALAQRQLNQQSA